MLNKKRLSEKAASFYTSPVSVLLKKSLTFAYMFKKDAKNVWTFASYDTTEEAFSDRNVFPVGVILKKEKINFFYLSKE